MPFGTLFSGLNLSPGSEDFRTLMGITAQPLRNAVRDDSEMMLINVADFERNTGRNIRDILAGMAANPGTAAPSPSPSPTPAPTPSPTPPAAAAPAAPGTLILNPLLDLDLVPVRPGDLITADSFNALIAACASLHMRLSLLEARAGGAQPSPTPTPTPGASPTPTPPATRLPPDLREAFLLKRTVAGKSTMVILARGTGLSGITSATLQARTGALGRATSVKLTKWRAGSGGLLFDIPKPTASLQRAVSLQLRVASPDGQDSVAVEEPTRAKSDALESALLKVEAPLDLVMASDQWRSLLGRFG